MDENENTHITVVINHLMTLTNQNPPLITQQRAAPTTARAQLRLQRRKGDHLQTKDVRRKGVYPRNPRSEKNKRKRKASISHPR